MQNQKLVIVRTAKLARWAANNEIFVTLDLRKQRRYVSIVSTNCVLIGRPEMRKQIRRHGKVSY